MKFEKYLQSKETSEWRKAYIDYRGLKRLINAVEFSRERHNIHQASDIEASGHRSSFITGHRASGVGPHADDRSLEDSGSQCPYLPALNFSVMDLSVEPSDLGTKCRRSYSIPSQDPMVSMQTCSSDTVTSSSLSALCQGLKQFPAQSNDTRRFMNPLVELPLHEILAQLTPEELTFFSMLDAQLDKVESFYLAREKEMMARSLVLLNQLEDLKDHREVFLETSTKKWWAVKLGWSNRNPGQPRQTPSQQPDEGQVFKLILSPTAIGDQCSTSSQSSDKKLLFMPALPSYRHACISPMVDKCSKSEQTHLSMSPDDPCSYIPAKKKLKKAVLEHYRGLEMLCEYRVLNVTGFRKAVKKFEKVTKIPVQKQYMGEKVGNCAFASDDGIIRNMTREIEEVYASVFASGDKKKALKQLRARTIVKSYHFSTFRSGVLFGFAIPALIVGLVKAQQPETQQAIPCWDILLFLYSLIFVPVLYSFLLGMNLVVWAKSRINYAFILDLKVSSCLDYRRYFEIPSLLLSTLCFAFWASFTRLGEPTMQYTAWLLVWLTFAIFVIVHPMPIMAKSPRYWFIKTVLKLFLSGIRPVEFADFWMGDQFSSFIFTLSNAPLFVCVYLDNFSDNWQKCRNLNSSRMWPISFGLASIPFIIRLLQSVRRYVDSRRVSHLINAGKYGSGIISYLFYFMWCYRQASRGPILVLWCVFNTCYSIYACSWDLLMDYSVLQPHSKHLFLRTELMYINHQWVYYLAMLSNLLLRFIWVIYIPQAGPSMMVRSFITGMFEMLRRLQWNFFRLESEHVGNMDQYRVTRELPLPYPLDFEVREEPGDPDDDDTLYAPR